ncbi:hypothetical protein [Undibacterium pigrum]|uniref:Uncharacterized protein n=1 Tax=Undibacterium pigrum TaxID=401470 RepID=A0A318INU5_9BURK|nr:hypothetical protein [Undibacterium pigrum]PXX36834.1 hypothetical protein DFR42_11940 [Undibacterium pigrum]
MNNNPATSEKDLRTLLRLNKQTLKGMLLPQALGLMAGYYQDTHYDVASPGDDALIVYKDITNRGRGTRFEIGIIRLFCMPDTGAGVEPQAALRLRLRLCYRFDMEIITELMSEDFWSYQCWSVQDLPALLQKVLATPAYQLLQGNLPAEVNINLEETTYLPADKRPGPDPEENWWGVWDQF